MFDAFKLDYYKIMATKLHVTSRAVKYVLELKSERQTSNVKYYNARLNILERIPINISV